MKILYISLVDWFWIKQRPHHFSEILSNNNQVTYLCREYWKKNNNVICKHTVDEKNLSKNDFNINENLNIKRKKLLPKEMKFDIVKKINDFTMRKYVLSLDKINNFDTIVVTHPSQYLYLDKRILDTKKIVYDCMDNHCEANVNFRELYLKWEKGLVSHCHSIVVSSKDLKYKLKERYDIDDEKITVINNGVEKKRFFEMEENKQQSIDFFKNNGKKRIGYIGTVSEWFDYELIRNVALKISEMDFYIIGPRESQKCVNTFKDMSNINIIDAQPYELVPSIINNLDIAIMPFVKSDFINSVNPVKIYEYAALGKPIIATRYVETEKFKDVVYLYDSEQEFVNHIHSSLQEDKHKKVNRVQFALDNTWEKRVEDFQAFIEKN